LIVVGLFRVTEPIRLAGRLVQDFGTRAAQR
jgi:hypothetical protein